MIIKPMIRNNICMNAHPEGCRLHVQKQIGYVRSRPRFKGPANVLVIGGSAGYGLATRVAAAFGAGSATLSVAFEKPASDKKPATVGWYTTEAFEAEAARCGLVSDRIYGDAFSNEIKAETIERAQRLSGAIDLVVYSLASGVRTDPADGRTYRSVLKPIGRPFRSLSIDPMSGEIKDVEIGPATPEEIEATVKVMGGEDWESWIDALDSAGVLAPEARTVAYSYIGPDLTRAVYREGTIGRAKEHLEETARRLDARLARGAAWVSINKALVTRASAVIPVVPLYLAILFRIMKARGLHEGCIEQMYRLFTERLHAGEQVPLDGEGRIRLDDWEMRSDVQEAVSEAWKRISAQNLAELADLDHYRRDFLNLHGFGYDEIDYEAKTET